jgi:hypothetical protein
MTILYQLDDEGEEKEKTLKKLRARLAKYESNQ